MGNPLPRNMSKGTTGELLVQLRLLEFGVQAAPPLKDTGNDLIAIRGEVVKFIQVKTEARRRNLPEVYHLVANVDLKKDNEGLFLYDKSKIWITCRDDPRAERRELTQGLVNEIWAV